jgi:hypothetical protein
VIGIVGGLAARRCTNENQLTQMNPRHPSLALVALAMLGGCRCTPPPATTIEARTGDARSADAETSASMQLRGGAALARIPEIARKLAALRGLELTAQVPVAYQDEAAHRALYRRELARELAPELAERITTAMVHLGLLPKRIDLPKYLEDAQLSLAGAYYDPSEKKIFLRQVIDDSAPFDASIAHELTHALQDQHFDLATYLPPSLDSDASAARRFIAEGDAMVVSDAYMRREVMPPSRMFVERFEEVAVGDPLAQMAKDASAEIPLVVSGPTVEVYFKGPIVILRALQRGGWDEVARLYTDPPQSTAQVLHPDTKLYPARQLPRHITIPLLPGQREVYADVIGELGWRLYFMQWHTVDPSGAAAGWGGDRCRVIRGPDGALVGVIVSVWDSEEDATQFVDAYVASLMARFPSAPPMDPRDSAGALYAAGHRVFVRRLGAKVFIVDGDSTATLFEQLISEIQVEERQASPSAAKRDARPIQ